MLLGKAGTGSRNLHSSLRRSHSFHVNHRKLCDLRFGEAVDRVNRTVSA
jgi:hypothetical protein